MGVEIVGYCETMRTRQTANMSVAITAATPGGIEKDYTPEREEEGRQGGDRGKSDNPLIWWFANILLVMFCQHIILLNSTKASGVTLRQRPEGFNPTTWHGQVS